MNEKISTNGRVVRISLIGKDKGNGRGYFSVDGRVQKYDISGTSDAGFSVSMLNSFTVLDGDNFVMDINPEEDLEKYMPHIASLKNYTADEARGLAIDLEMTFKTRYQRKIDVKLDI
ncbi:MAG: hypothetical protein ABIF08_00940 [Nanoarchaeota archaeon]